jgi:UDP-N-acetylmuramate--alanine ligase
MSGLARLLLGRGLRVTGSELLDWPALAGLRALGGTIHMRHDPSNLDGVDTVVYSSAIPAGHVELVEARARGLRVLHRSEALAAAMTGRRAVAVAGTHGKTTTTAMLTVILRQAGLDPSFVIGGEIRGVAGNAHHGGGDLFVAEADEHDRSFLRYRPHVGMVTNIDSDHLNTYGDLAGLAAAFEEFGRTVDPGGFLVTCADDPATRRLAVALRAGGRVVHTYGVAADADLRVAELTPDGAGVSYRAWLDGEPLGRLTLAAPGAHLALNSAGAALVGLRLGAPLAAVAAALAAFPGVRRRFELKGSAGGVRVYDEYAYHPTSMTVALRTLRELAGGGRLIVVFQPYRVYRTRALAAELAAALSIADEVVVLEVFGPGEVRQPGEGGASLAAAVDLPAGCKAFLPAGDAAPAEVAARARPGDLVVTMGAPPISLLGDELLAALAAPPSPAAASPAPPPAHPPSRPGPR